MARGHPQAMNISLYLSLASATDVLASAVLVRESTFPGRPDGNRFPGLLGAGWYHWCVLIVSYRGGLIQLLLSGFSGDGPC